MKRWIFKPPTQTHLRRLADWAPQYVDGDIVNGCMEMDDYAESIQDELEAATISFDPSLAYSLDDMPIFRYDDPGFQTWLNRRIEICDVHRENQTQCLLPWEIQKSLNAQQKRSDWLYFNQNKRPSCAMHADHFAFCESTLMGIALGAPLIYESFNPIYTFYLAKGGSLRGGLNLAPCSKASNTIGQFPESVIGTDNQNVNRDWKKYESVAQKHKAGIVLMPTDSAETGEGFSSIDSIIGSEKTVSPVKNF